jgi:rfaE bifunctional protein nucleotidyltransferase chain/domain/rfaE bifunctional protein kinase chain/domain
MTRLLVAGDSLLDIDLVGRVERVCPDAPVPVVDQVAERSRPGGAALAAMLAASDGHDVTLLTPLAFDDAGIRLRNLLGDAIRLAELPYQGATPVKRRVRVAGQSLIRIDAGGGPGVATLTREASRTLDRALDPALDDVEAVLVSDYGRGLAGLPEFRDRVRRLARRVPVVWDPHPRGASPVRGVRLVTPNSGELRQFADRHGVAVPGEGLAAIAGCAHGLVTAWQVAAVAVTMAERGALLSYGQGAPVMLPAAAVQVGDACGAGDRFAATVTACLGAGSVTTEAVQAAVAAASWFVAEGGAEALPSCDGPGPRPTPGSPGGLDDLLARVRARGGVVVATGGCFDLLHAGHVATLRAARRLGDCLVVCLNSDTSVRRLKGPGRPVMPAVDRARVLEALECVDSVVVFEDDTPVRVLERLRPDVWVKGGDYAGADLPEARVLTRWGGQAVVLPYVPGRSTTALVRELARADAGRREPR